MLNNLNKVETMKQYVLTPSAGKRLIAKALAAHPTILCAVKAGTVVIVAGTTNGYVAEEILKTLGACDGFSRKRFFRGINPAAWSSCNVGRASS